MPESLPIIIFVLALIAGAICLFVQALDAA